MKPNCNSCRLLIKTGGYRTRPAERSCGKLHFHHIFLNQFKPRTDCPDHTKRAIKALTKKATGEQKKGSQL